MAVHIPRLEHSDPIYLLSEPKADARAHLWSSPRAAAAAFGKWAGAIRAAVAEQAETLRSAKLEGPRLWAPKIRSQAAQPMS